MTRIFILSLVLIAVASFGYWSVGNIAMQVDAMREIIEGAKE